MFDSYNRPLDYLRVAVTDRCNHRCAYCMPAEGVALKPRGNILGFEQIQAVVRVAAGLGVRKVRLTGGEPLVREGIERLVAMLSPLPGLEELCMTTNGVLLAPLARALKAAGLGRVNISINSLDPARYRAITRCGELGAALEGLDAALACGLGPVKVNMVVFPDTGRGDIDAMRAFCESKSVKLQLIEHFNLARREHGPLRGDASRPPACSKCNRLRLTADGILKPCLFSDDEIRVDFADIRGSLLAAAACKPEAGVSCTTRAMNEIGG